MSQFMEQVQAEYLNGATEKNTVFNESDRHKAALLLRKTLKSIFLKRNRVPINLAKMK